MCADHGDYSKIGSNRSNAKIKQENRRRTGKKIVVAGLRTSDNDEEMYAIVTKMLGNGMCEVSGGDGVTRLCIIRKKFRGRLRQGNMVTTGATVLVGLRQWERNERSTMPKCDLLEVYNESEVRKLRQRGGINLEKASRPLISNIVDDDDLEFDNGGDDEVGNRNRRNRMPDGDDVNVNVQPNRDYNLDFVSEDDSNSDSEFDSEFDSHNTGGGNVVRHGSESDSDDIDVDDI